MFILDNSTAHHLPQAFSVSPHEARFKLGCEGHGGGWSDNSYSVADIHDFLSSHKSTILLVAVSIPLTAQYH